MRYALALQTGRRSLVVVHTPDGAMGRWLRRLVAVRALVLALLPLASLVLCMGLAVSKVWQDSSPMNTELIIAEVNKRLELNELRHERPDSLYEIYGMDGPPRDAWGHHLLYLPWAARGGEWEIISLGADGRPGGTDLDADIHWSTLRRAPRVR